MTEHHLTSVEATLQEIEVRRSREIGYSDWETRALVLATEF